MVLVGYARVSTVEQDSALQLDAFAAAGVRRIFEDQRSGVGARPALERCLYSLRAGDVLTVYKVDRVARSLTDLLRVVSRVEAAGAQFRSLTEPIDTSTPIGRMTLQLLGSFAEFERSVIRERCAAGRAAAVARGVHMGRPMRIDWDRVERLLGDGFSQSAAARAVGASPSTVNKWLKARAFEKKRLLSAD